MLDVSQGVGAGSPALKSKQVCAKGERRLVQWGFETRQTRQEYRSFVGLLEHPTVPMKAEIVQRLNLACDPAGRIAHEKGNAVARVMTAPPYTRIVGRGRLKTIDAFQNHRLAIDGSGVYT